MDLSYFQCVSFRCSWWYTFDRNNVKEYCDSALICINSRNMWDDSKETYVFPKYYNQVFFHPHALDIDRWFILRHRPIPKHVYDNNSVIMPTKEYSEGDDNKEWYLHVLFHHLHIHISFCYFIFDCLVILFVFHVMMVKIEILLLNAVRFKQFQLVNNQYDVKYGLCIWSNLWLYGMIYAIVLITCIMSCVYI